MTTITWTKCSDALPDDEIAVLLAFADGDVWVGVHHFDGWRSLMTGALFRSQVTHWADLPPHPEAA